MNILFVIGAIFYCFGIVIEDDIIKAIAKPIPLVILILSIKPDNKYKKLIFWGFIFSVLGDVFLMKIVNLFFYGLVSFLIAHIFYIRAFINKDSSVNLTSSLPFYIVAVVFGYFLYPYLGDMFIPVFVYMFVIITMVWRSFVQRKSTKNAIYAFIGAILFVISDSNLGIATFFYDYKYSGFVIILTYWFAQYLIMLSAQEKKVNSIK